MCTSILKIYSHGHQKIAAFGTVTPVIIGKSDGFYIYYLLDQMPDNISSIKSLLLIVCKTQPNWIESKFTAEARLANRKAALHRLPQYLYGELLGERFK